MIYRSRSYLTSKECLHLYNALILPHLSYAIAVWGSASKCFINKLEITQKRIIRLISGARYDQHTSPLFKKLKILKLNDLYELELIKLIHEHEYGTLPHSLQNSLPKITTIHSYNTRTNRNLYIPCKNTEISKKASVFQRGALLWNALPVDIKQEKVLHEFVSKYKNLVISKY